MPLLNVCYDTQALERVPKSYRKRSVVLYNCTSQRHKDKVMRIKESWNDLLLTAHFETDKAGQILRAKLTYRRALYGE